MSYESALRKVESDEQRRLRQERNAEVWEQILNETDQTPGTAFANAVINWCGGELSWDKYEMLCATSALPEFADKKWHAGDHTFYVNKVAEVLKNRRWSEESIRYKVAELNNKTKPEVRAYLQKLGFIEEVHTLEQAKDYLQRHRLLTSQRQFADKTGALWPRLPAMVVPEGHVQARPLNAFFLYKILDVAGLRKYVNRYSLEQINERVENTRESLRGESQ